MTHHVSASEDHDIDLIAIWLRRDPVRWIAGAMAGLVAAAVSIGVAGMMAKSAGMSFWYLPKIAAMPLVGAASMNFDAPFSMVITGMIVHGVLCAILGVIYAHFTGTNHFWALMGAGFMWGTFAWIFILNLFVQSFMDVNAQQIPHGAGFFVSLAFGFSLVTVRVFDRMLRGSRR